MNPDQSLSALSNIKVDERFSEKSKRPYHVLCVSFKNGYTFETFLNAEQKLAITLSLRAVKIDYPSDDKKG